MSHSILATQPNPAPQCKLEPYQRAAVCGPRAGTRGLRAAVAATLAVLALALAPAPSARAGEGVAPHEWNKLLRAHSRGGGPGVRVRVVEMADFQCPFCARVAPTIDELLEQYGGQIEHVYLHNPLPFHAEARPSAHAAVAAAMQGRFWEMHRLLVAGSRSLSPEVRDAAAKELRLDRKRYVRDRDSALTARYVDRTEALARATGMTGTPSFWINGVELKGAQPILSFQQVVDAEIAASIAAKARGAAWVARRTREHNPDLQDYLEGKREPTIPAVAPVSDSAPAEDLTVWKLALAQDAPTAGRQDGLVTLVLFSDFQCPFCQRLEPTLKGLLEANPELRVAFLNNPLPFHARATPAAHAALCAHEQGRFWDMHDLLFANGKALEDADLADYARRAGLDLARWEACQAAGRYQARIGADQGLAASVQARGTPTSFINGRKLTGAQPAEAFQRVIDQELERAQELLKAGIPRARIYEEAITKGETFQPLAKEVHAFDTAGSPRLGPTSAPIQVVIFGDYQCPYCARFEGKLASLRTHYGDRLSVVYKQFPLSFHTEARLAAAAALCAQELQAFEPLHKAFFGQQQALHLDELVALAEQAGVHGKHFRQCVAAERYKAIIDRDTAEAIKAGVRGTPTIFINGRMVDGGSGLGEQAFISLIDKHVLGAVTP